MRSMFYSRITRGSFKIFGLIPEFKSVVSSYCDLEATWWKSCLVDIYRNRKMHLLSNSKNYSERLNDVG